MQHILLKVYFRIKKKKRKASETKSRMQEGVKIKYTGNLGLI